MFLDYSPDSPLIHSLQYSRSTLKTQCKLKFISPNFLCQDHFAFDKLDIFRKPAIHTPNLSFGTHPELLQKNVEEDFKN